MPNKPIDAARALQLKEQGFTWAEVGKIISVEEGRPVPYLESSIANAVRKHKAD